MNRSLWIEFLKKIASLIVKIKYSNVPAEYEYFYRDTIVCKYNQLKYFLNDFILRKKYKSLNYEGEFGEELQFALPFAYWHYKNGTLKNTISFKGTKEMYFFSLNHSEENLVRSNEGNYNYELPRILYSQDYDMKKWLQVPLKETYENDIYTFDKPLLIIANRYNTEWDGPPISYFSIEILDYLISILKDKYTIVYNRPKTKDIVNDNSIVKDLNEYDWLRSKHPEVILIQDLFEKNEIKANNFNHFQLCLYANCSHFISVHGGTATLASYFGGKNIIYSQKGGEHYFKCFEKLYPQLSGAEIIHAKTENELMGFVTKLY